LRYHQKGDRIETIQAEAAAIREDTGSFRLSRVEEKELREFKPNDIEIIKWVRILAIVGAAFVAIVIGTVSALGWLDGRVEEQIAPVHRRLDSIDSKLTEILVNRDAP